MGEVEPQRPATADYELQCATLVTDQANETRKASNVMRLEDSQDPVGAVLVTAPCSERSPLHGLAPTICYR